MEAPGNPKPNPSEKLLIEIVDRLEQLYPKLSPSAPAPDTALPEFGAPVIEVPSFDVLTSRVSQCSFKIFSDPVSYAQSERAKCYVSWISPRNDVYRIYFNDYSKKVYVDLNGERWAKVRSPLEQELLYCDILRTLIFVLTCEVELFEAKEAEKAAEMNAVTSDVTEVIIP